MATNGGLGRELAVFGIDHVVVPGGIVFGGWATSTLLSRVSDDTGAVLLMCAWLVAIAWTFFLVPWLRAEGGGSFAEQVLRVPAEAATSFERTFTRTVVDVALLGILAVVVRPRRSLGRRLTERAAKTPAGVGSV